MLFDKECAVLRSWDPQGGLSLDNFVGLVAHRHALSVLRSKRRNPYSEEAVDDLDQRASQSSRPDGIVVAQRTLAQLVARLEQELSPKGLHLFQRIFMDEADVADICEELDMTRDAVYAWRSRLRKRLVALAQENMSDSGTPPRNTSPEDGP